MKKSIGEDDFYGGSRHFPTVIGSRRCFDFWTTKRMLIDNDVRQQHNPCAWWCSLIDNKGKTRVPDLMWTTKFGACIVWEEELVPIKSCMAVVHRRSVQGSLRLNCCFHLKIRLIMNRKCGFLPCLTFYPCHPNYNGISFLV